MYQENKLSSADAVGMQNTCGPTVFQASVTEARGVKGLCWREGKPT